MRDFFEMGGYGAYVWSAYGITLVALLGFLWLSYRWMRRVEHELDSQKPVDGSKRRSRKPTITAPDGTVVSGAAMAEPSGELASEDTSEGHVRDRGV